MATNDQHIRVVPASWPGHLKEPILVVSIVVDDALENSEIQVDKVENFQEVNIQDTGARRTILKTVLCSVPNMCQIHFYKTVK